MDTFSVDRGDGVMPEMATTLARPPIDPSKTALVVIDMVNWQIRRLTPGGFVERCENDGVDTAYLIDRVESTAIPNLRRLISGVRDVGVKIAYTRLGCYQPDYSDALRNLQEMFRAAGARDGTKQCEVVDEIAPAQGDISLVKTGTSGFYTSGLDTHLRNMGIDHVIYTGVVTNACVLTTAAGGFDRGYYGYVVSDATATFSAALQTSTEEMLSGYLAKVVSTDEMLSMLGAMVPV